MKALNPVKKNKSSKEEREHRVLMGLIEYFINTGKPVGSNTLKERGFEDLSSATIRNYFASLERQGYLEQQHTSGGRIPTEEAFKLYAEEALKTPEIADYQKNKLNALNVDETHEIASYLQEAVETLSALTNCAIFVSAPRFDHDYICRIKIMEIDTKRCLCAIITDFGVIQSEILHIDTKLSAFSIKRIEEYFHWRITGHDEPQNMRTEEEELAQKIYNELMVRYVISYSTFNDDDIFRTGFSKLLAYPEFHDASTLANSLTILETKRTIRLFLKECSGTNSLKCWIGSDFIPLTNVNPHSMVLAIPYYINNQAVGAVGLMGPIRSNYKNLSGIIGRFSEIVSDTLTRNIYKHKISFRQPTTETHFLRQQEQMLLEDKRN
ncbi:MAG: heat-inducible transcriptional repressor HrcA [Chlamydiota bacterium]|nr:heat-inducible transcriptional repressor HrcA [Chlamydiota bacterium]